MVATEDISVWLWADVREAMQGVCGVTGPVSEGTNLQLSPSPAKRDSCELTRSGNLMGKVLPISPVSLQQTWGQRGGLAICGEEARCLEDRGTASDRSLYLCLPYLFLRLSLILWILRFGILGAHTARRGAWMGLSPAAPYSATVGLEEPLVW